MAEHHPSDENNEGTMDIRANVQTWLAFWKATVYSVIGLAVLAVLMFVFRAHNGY